MGKTLFQLFAAMVMVSLVATAALAQDQPMGTPSPSVTSPSNSTDINVNTTTTPGPVVTPAPIPGSGNTNINVNTTTTVTPPIQGGLTSSDAELAATLASLGTVWSKYDQQIMAVLYRDQQQMFQTMMHNGESNTGYWFKNAFTMDNVNGYVGYLSQRLHLEPLQQQQVQAIERHMLAEAGPLWVAYQNRLAALQDMARTRTVTNVQVQPQQQVPQATAPETPPPQPTIETPPPAPEPRSEVKPTQAPPRKQFIRNRDLK